MNFVIHQMRAAKSSKKSIMTEERNSKKRKHVDSFWWAREKMAKELGEKKAAAVISAKALKTRPCSITGSLDEDLIEHCMPIDWEQMTIEDLVGMRINADCGAGEADLALLRGIDDLDGNEENNSSSSADKPDVKMHLDEKKEGGAQAGTGVQVLTLCFRNTRGMCFARSGIDLIRNFVRIMSIQLACRKTETFLEQATIETRPLVVM